VATASDLADWSERFDYVFASGTFNNNFAADVERWKEVVHANLRSMFSVCRIATMVTMISCYVDYRYDRLYYAAPGELSDLAAADLTRRFVIDHSYSKYDLTAVFYRDE
jgi:hypothetical protein